MRLSAQLYMKRLAAIALFALICPAFYVLQSSEPIKSVWLEQKQTVVLHIGPQKTGSTALQVAFDMFHEELADDNILQPTEKDLPGIARGVKIGTCLALCLHRKERYRCNPHLLNDTLPKFLDIASAHPARPIVLISAEDLHSHFIDVEQLKTLFARFHIRLLRVYRHFYEWLPSFYYQLNRNKIPPPPINQWLSEEVLGDSISRMRVFEVYEKMFDSIDVVDYSRAKQEKGLVYEVLCRHRISKTFNACAALKKNSTLPPANVGINLDFARILWTAAKRGIVNRTSIERKLFHKISNRLESWWVSHGSQTQEVPSRCLGDSVFNTIVETSVELHNYMQKYLRNHESLDSVRSKALASRSRFCAMDAEAIMSDPIWIEAVERAANGD
eukprot:CAMPEP_0116556678 /NCGR_PEP_ID=MMETSP0397-20121206/8825_1 /TAXON_ID=216820 /ORGANISM="Cyclophora tenuis, Strain ECT3854" /LENGTH=386 /DNA_ID=CAMNT_0004082065 /DNA_START=21 /DNA_END=1181 /DNA_ORIENTATION=-